MTHEEKTYTAFSTFFCVLIVIGNLTYQKFVLLSVPGVYTFQLSAGAVLYPLTFLITDVITEFFGKEKANFTVRLSIYMNVMVALIISFMVFLPATTWSKIDDPTFSKVFGFYSIAFLGSILACYIAQSVDVILYSLIRKLTHGKYLWLRSNGSTAVSLLIDTTVVISFMAVFGIFPKEQMLPLIGNSYSWKLFFTVCSTPLFYGLVWCIRYTLRQKG